MLHEIHPKTFHVEYRNIAPEPDDMLVLFDGEKVFCHVRDGEAALTRVGEYSVAENMELRYLFSIDELRFFMADVSQAGFKEPPGGYEWHDFSIFRMTGPRHIAFAVITAQQLYKWYVSRRYCGACGEKTIHAESERACVCPVCGITDYPRLSPVVIVAVTNGEDLLVTRYRDRPYRRYALVAGFSEIGESLEDTVRREVFEETGVHVHNIRYYKSQPWGLTSTLLSGFYCDLDGDSSIVLDENELSEAIWLPRAEIPPADSDIALTAEMMEMFRTGRM